MISYPIKTELISDSVFQIKWSDYSKKVALIHNHLTEVAEFKENHVGWMTAPLEQNDELIFTIEELATEIKMNAHVLVVIGVGGSYLGAKAIQEALKPYFATLDNGIEVLYVGQNLSGSYLKQLINYLKNKEVYVNVVSKSGTTLETTLAFRVFREYMENRYNKNATHRIIVTTDAKKGNLNEMASVLGYRKLVIPSNVGGRYSALTAAGLLPIAVSGIDVNQLLLGAKEAALLLDEGNLDKNVAYQYAVIRNELYNRGYHIEVLASFEPSLSKLHEWWKQLFAESEGKNKKGLFPSSAIYTTDLHSIGQYIQEGAPILFETILHFQKVNEDCIVPYDKNSTDCLDYLSQKSFNEINETSKQGVVKAHTEAGSPVIQIELAFLDAYHIGYLIYFFMKACAMSSFLLDVNPFNQPGVEAYKSKIQELLMKESVYQ